MWAAPAIRWRFVEVDERVGGRGVPNGVRIGFDGNDFTSHGTEVDLPRFARLKV
jgi:hypothetical protein